MTATGEAANEPRGVTIWLTGLSGAGKSTISSALAGELELRGKRVEILDGDVIRENLSKGLGFSKEDRDENIRRIGFVAQLLTRHGAFVLVAAISPYRDVRDEVRARIGDFVEVHVDCSIEELSRRDVKGLYAKALSGEIKNFTGVSDPYEAPLHPEVVVSSETQTVGESVADVLARAAGSRLPRPRRRPRARAPRAPVPRSPLRRRARPSATSRAPASCPTVACSRCGWLPRERARELSEEAQALPANRARRLGPQRPRAAGRRRAQPPAGFHAGGRRALGVGADAPLRRHGLEPADHAPGGGGAGAASWAPASGWRCGRAASRWPS